MVCLAASIYLSVLIVCLYGLASCLDNVPRYVGSLVVQAVCQVTWTVCQSAISPSWLLDYPGYTVFYPALPTTYMAV